MINGDLIKLLRRGVVALEKIAGIEERREIRPATLSTANYTREEREREAWKAARAKEQEQRDQKG